MENKTQTRFELYHNNEFKVISVLDASGLTSRVLLIYDVDLHCATILTYHRKGDIYDATFSHAFNRAWAVLSAAYSRESSDPRALFRFFRGLRDYFRAKKFLIKTADGLYKTDLREAFMKK